MPVAAGYITRRAVAVVPVAPAGAHDGCESGEAAETWPTLATALPRRRDTSGYGGAARPAGTAAVLGVRAARPRPRFGWLRPHRRDAEPYCRADPLPGQDGDPPGGAHVPARRAGRVDAVRPSRRGGADRCAHAAAPAGVGAARGVAGRRGQGAVQRGARALR